MVAIDVLTTKLHIPPRPSGLVSRARLIGRLNESLSGKLALVSAPAGFGKTTLVSDWIDSLDAGARAGRDPVRIGWLSLDEADNDPVRFLAHLIAALNQGKPVGGPFGEAASRMIRSPQPAPTEVVLISILNELDALPERVLLVLDDYHFIDSPSVDSALAFCLEHLPPGMVLIIITRVDPQFSLARLRAQGHLQELRAVDLRFTQAETADFLNQKMRLNLSAEDVAALDSRTEGWIAGLQMAALSMRGREDPAAFISSFSGSHTFVLDYLMEEVLDQLSNEIQDFLLRTSVLDRLTGSLCDAVLGRDDSRETLELLTRANLFILPLDEERHWFRYHHLFAELLGQRLSRTRPGEIGRLHRRASAWYEQHGLASDAIEHALHCQDFERAVDMIEQHVDHVLFLGERSQLGRWLDAIPLDATLTSPHLCLLHASNLYINGRIEGTERYLQTAEAALQAAATLEPQALKTADGGRTRPDRRVLRGRVATVQSYLAAYHGDSERAIQFAQRALEDLPASDPTWRCSAFDSLGNTHSSTGQIEAAYQARMAAMETSQATDNIYMILFAGVRLAATLRDLGRLQEAVAICRRQLKLAEESGLSQTALVGWLRTLFGEILAEMNELSRAVQMVNEGVELTERGRDVMLLGRSYLSQMRVLVSKGELALAAETLKELMTLPGERELSPSIQDQLGAWQARVWLAQDKLAPAAQWVEEIQLELDGDSPCGQRFERLVVARTLIAQGKLAEASKLLQDLYEAAEAGGGTSRAIEVLVLQALASQAAGELPRALAKLEQALAIAEPRGFIRTFVDEGPPMASLLREALAGGTAGEYVRRLLAAFSADQPEPARATTPRPGHPDLVEPLSERETEVLELIGEGLTNREIAGKLYLSLNTVKVHTRNIYGKLGVNNRIQATARARELGVMPAL